MAVWCEHRYLKQKNSNFVCAKKIKSKPVFGMTYEPRKKLSFNFSSLNMPARISLDEIFLMGLDITIPVQANSPQPD
jgi:hypothetical protein